jgi:hypothetical protein
VAKPPAAAAQHQRAGFRGLESSREKKDPGQAGVLVSSILFARGDQNVTLQLLM